ncbi:MAG: hypothetical protein IJM54_07420 [Thermoguttaceae bacterium]|nr:hypothetical protein [Thermoguttaceae bacterium]
MRRWMLTTDRATWELLLAFALWLLYVAWSSGFFRNIRWRRLLAATALLWLFAAPCIKIERETPPPVTVVLDDSESMARTHDQTTVYARAKELADVVGQAARGSGSKVSSRALSGSDVDAPDASTSALSSVRALTGRVVLITDGIENGVADAPSQNAGPTVDAIVVGSSQPEFDWRLEDVPDSFVVYPKEQARLRGSLRLFGSEEKRRAIVRLKNLDDDVPQWETTLESENGAIELDYAWDPPEDKPARYRLEVVDERDVGSDASSFAEFCRENNVADFTIIPGEKKLSVLLIDNQPRYEYRYMRVLLQREETVDARFLLLSADPEVAERDERAVTLEELDRKTLANFDALLIGDVPDDVWNDKFRPIADAALRTERSPAIWFLGGKINDSRLAPGELVENDAKTESFRLAPTTEARRIFGKLADALAEIELTRTTPDVKPTFETQTLFTEQDDPTVPLFVMIERGSTKIAWQGFDELWRLQTLDDKTLYRRFVLRFLERLASTSTGEALDERTDGPDDALPARRDVEKENVAARLDDVERLASATGGTILDLRDVPPQEAKRLTKEFVAKQIENSPTVASEKRVPLAPPDAFVPLALALLLLAWIPGALGRRQKDETRR